MARRTEQDASMLAMALIGYEVEKKRIEGKIAEIQSLLGRRRLTLPAQSSSVTTAPRKRILSAAARARIAAAQRKRWAEHRKKKAAEKA